MGPIPWSVDDVVAGLRGRLLLEGAVTDGFAGIDVRTDLPGTPGVDASGHQRVFVLFRWRRDPATYAVAFPLRSLGITRPAVPGVSTGVTVELLDDWLTEVGWWLMEELDTGLVSRAGRSVVDHGVVLLDAHDGADDVLPDGYYIGDVHLGTAGDRGGHLARVGLDVTTARGWLASGRLITWLHAYVDNRRGEPFVGHAAVAWSGLDLPAGRTADLDVLDVVPGTPVTVAAALAYTALRSAVAAGAGTITSHLHDPALDEVGFGPARGDTQALTWQDIRKPDLRRGGTRPPGS